MVIQSFCYIVIVNSKQLKMNCRLCDQSFGTSQAIIPRVLVSCGHTLCQTCIHTSFEKGVIKCPECGQISSGSSFAQYPVNANLISLLNQQAVCKTHNQKLQAYCQRDNELLCLSCVINGHHKNHKISPIAEKVAKDRAILRQCAKSIQTSTSELMELGQICKTEIQRLEHQYKDYLFETGLCFNTLKSTLKELQESCLAKGKAEYERGVSRYNEAITQLREKNKFMDELMQIYEQVMSLPNLQYLNEDNKRIFIMENCKVKKPKIQNAKLLFSKTNIYNEVHSAVQQLISFQKKMQGQSTPTLKHKKSSRNKEPTILEVNLNEHYKKHYKNSVPPPQQKIKLSHKQKSVILIKTPKHFKEKSYSQKQEMPLAVSVSGGDDKINQSFQSDVYIPASMVNSFMESSEHSLSIKGSQADFTICNFEHQIYHFGSFNESSVEFGKMGYGCSNNLISSGINRSKAQCAIIPSYSPFFCLILGGKSSGDEKLDTIVEFDLQTNKWKNSLFRLSEPKSGFGCAVNNNRLYVCGGSNNNKSLKTFEEYRVSGLGLSKIDLSPMNHSRDQLGMVLGYDGFIYACGGINESGSVLSSCERYNWTKSRWEMIPSMKKPRRCFALVSLPHGIYAIGGYDGNQYLNEVELFDFTTQKWIRMPPMSQARFAHTAVTSSDMQNIYVCGGFNKGPLKSVQKFNALEERWSPAQDMQTERFLHCSVVVNI